MADRIRIFLFLIFIWYSCDLTENTESFDSNSGKVTTRSLDVYKAGYPSGGSSFGGDSLFKDAINPREKRESKTNCINPTITHIDSCIENMDLQALEECFPGLKNAVKYEESLSEYQTPENKKCLRKVFGSCCYDSRSKIKERIKKMNDIDLDITFQDEFDLDSCDENDMKNVLENVKDCFEKQKKTFDRSKIDSKQEDLAKTILEFRGKCIDDHTSFSCVLQNRTLFKNSVKPLMHLLKEQSLDLLESYGRKSSKYNSTRECLKKIDYNRLEDCEPNVAYRVLSLKSKQNDSPLIKSVQTCYQDTLKACHKTATQTLMKIMAGAIEGQSGKDDDDASSDYYYSEQHAVIKRESSEKKCDNESMKIWKQGVSQCLESSVKTSKDDEHIKLKRLMEYVYKCVQKTKQSDDCDFHKFTRFENTVKHIHSVIKEAPSSISSEFDTSDERSSSNKKCPMPVPNQTKTRYGLVECEGTEPGDMCYIICQPGYVAKPTNIIQCEENGKWSEDELPTCVKDDKGGSSSSGTGTYRSESFSRTSCSTPPEPKNGYLDEECTNPKAGDQYQVMCNEGYKPSNSKIIYCKQNRQWSDKAPDCISEDNENKKKAPCSDQVAPKHSHLTKGCTKATKGAVCQLSCQKGYKPSSIRAVTCQENGQWSDDLPTCVSDDCESKEKEDSGTTTASSTTCPKQVAPKHGHLLSGCTEGTPGELCQLLCDQCYKPSSIRLIFCQENGQWSDDLPTCIPDKSSHTSGKNASCPNQSSPSHGHLLSGCKDASSGEFCQVLCDEGYKPSSIRVVICQENGQWSDNLPSCITDGSSQKVFESCPKQETPKHGYLMESCKKGKAGEVCELFCKSGYRPSSVRVLTCQKDGQWSDDLPSCIPKEHIRESKPCSDQSPPNGGYLEGKCEGAKKGDTCQVKCKAGYKISSMKIVACLGGGEWSGSLPTCSLEKKTPIKDKELKCVLDIAAGKHRQCIVKFFLYFASVQHAHHTKKSLESQLDKVKSCLENHLKSCPFSQILNLLKTYAAIFHIPLPSSISPIDIVTKVTLPEGHKWCETRVVTEDVPIQTSEIVVTRSSPERVEKITPTTVIPLRFTAVIRLPQKKLNPPAQTIIFYFTLPKKTKKETIRPTTVDYLTKTNRKQTVEKTVTLPKVWIKWYTPSKYIKRQTYTPSTVKRFSYKPPEEILKVIIPAVTVHKKYTAGHTIFWQIFTPTTVSHIRRTIKPGPYTKTKRPPKVLVKIITPAKPEEVTEEKTPTTISTTKYTIKKRPDILKKNDTTVKIVVIEGKEKPVTQEVEYTTETETVQPKVTSFWQKVTPTTAFFSRWTVPVKKNKTKILIPRTVILHFTPPDTGTKRVLTPTTQIKKEISIPVIYAKIIFPQPSTEKVTVPHAENTYTEGKTVTKTFTEKKIILIIADEQSKNGTTIKLIVNPNEPTHFTKAEKYRTIIINQEPKSKTYSEKATRTTVQTTQIRVRPKTSEATRPAPYTVIVYIKPSISRVEKQTRTTVEYLSRIVTPRRPKFTKEQPQIKIKIRIPKKTTKTHKITPTTVKTTRIPIETATEEVEFKGSTIIIKIKEAKTKIIQKTEEQPSTATLILSSEEEEEVRVTPTATEHVRVSLPTKDVTRREPKGKTIIIHIEECEDEITEEITPTTENDFTVPIQRVTVFLTHPTLRPTTIIKKPSIDEDCEEILTPTEISTMKYTVPPIAEQVSSLATIVRWVIIERPGTSYTGEESQPPSKVVTYTPPDDEYTETYPDITTVLKRKTPATATDEVVGIKPKTVIIYIKPQTRESTDKFDTTKTETVTVTPRENTIRVTKPAPWILCITIPAEGDDYTEDLTRTTIETTKYPLTTYSDIITRTRTTADFSNWVITTKDLELTKTLPPTKIITYPPIEWSWWTKVTKSTTKTGQRTLPTKKITAYEKPPVIVLINFTIPEKKYSEWVVPTTFQDCEFDFSKYFEFTGPGALTKVLTYTQPGEEYNITMTPKRIRTTTPKVTTTVTTKRTTPPSVGTVIYTPTPKGYVCIYPPPAPPPVESCSSYKLKKETISLEDETSSSHSTAETSQPKKKQCDAKDEILPFLKNTDQCIKKKLSQSGYKEKTIESFIQTARDCIKQNGPKSCIITNKEVIDKMWDYLTYFLQDVPEKEQECVEKLTKNKKLKSCFHSLSALGPSLEDMEDSAKTMKPVINCVKSAMTSCPQDLHLKSIKLILDLMRIDGIEVDDSDSSTVASTISKIRRKDDGYEVCEDVSEGQRDENTESTAPDECLPLFKDKDEENQKYILLKSCSEDQVNQWTKKLEMCVDEKAAKVEKQNPDFLTLTRVLDITENCVDDQGPLKCRAKQKNLFKSVLSNIFTILKQNTECSPNANCNASFKMESISRCVPLFHQYLALSNEAPSKKGQEKATKCLKDTLKDCKDEIRNKFKDVLDASMLYDETFLEKCGLEGFEFCTPGYGSTTKSHNFKTTTPSELCGPGGILVRMERDIDLVPNQTSTLFDLTRNETEKFTIDASKVYLNLEDQNCKSEDYDKYYRQLNACKERKLNRKMLKMKNNCIHYNGKESWIALLECLIKDQEIRLKCNISSAKQLTEFLQHTSKQLYSYQNSDNSVCSDSSWCYYKNSQPLSVCSWAYNKLLSLEEESLDGASSILNITKEILNCLSTIWTNCSSKVPIMSLPFVYAPLGVGSSLIKGLKFKTCSSSVSSENFEVQQCFTVNNTNELQNTVKNIQDCKMCVTDRKEICLFENIANMFEITKPDFIRFSRCLENSMKGQSDCIHKATAMASEVCLPYFYKCAESTIDGALSTMLSSCWNFHKCLQNIPENCPKAIHSVLPAIYYRILGLNTFLKKYQITAFLGT